VARLVEALEAAALGRPPALEAKRPDLGRAAAFSIAPAVTIDNEASTGATVIEASGRDRPGLLAALARILAEAELSIQSAHVDNYGERAVDAFYVVTRQGKLTEPQRAAAVRARLIEALEHAETDVARPRLERARASAAR
jgi:[protein-PII] uridylyltransferase